MRGEKWIPRYFKSTKGSKVRTQRHRCANASFDVWGVGSSRIVQLIVAGV